MNNLSFASRTAWDNMHLQGGCVLQLDYNVLLFLREIAFLVIFSEKVLLQTIKIQGAVFPTCLWILDSESPMFCRDLSAFLSPLLFYQGVVLLVSFSQTTGYLWQVKHIPPLTVAYLNFFA